MTAFLIDEMFPASAAALMRDSHGYDAVHVGEIGLQAADDALVVAAARAEGRAMVTEDVADVVGERDVVLIFVLKRNLPTGGPQGAALAKALNQWARANPEPYLGAHWPPVT